MTTAYDFSAKSIDGRETKLADYKGKVSLIVNVASECGLTPQYTGLEELQRKYHGRGFNVLGFPCNQFGGQEPATKRPSPLSARPNTASTFRCSPRST